MLMAMSGRASWSTTHALLLGWVYLMARVLSDYGQDLLNSLGLNGIICKFAL